MPRVPTYDGPQLGPQVVRGAEMGQIDASSGVQALARTVENMGSVIERRVKRDVETDANRIDTEVTAGWLEWDAANRPKFKGQNAADYQEAAAKWWDDARTKYTGGVSDLVREQVGTALGRKRLQAMGAVMGHVNAEKERFADESSEAAAQTTIAFGVDTGDIAGAGARVRRIVAEKGARKGWTTEMVQADQERLLGTLHLSAITRLVEGNPEAARSYYEANKGEIPATAQPRVEHLLKAEGDNQFAIQFAAGVAAKPLADQLEAASKISDPERRQKTLTQIKVMHTQVREAQAERERVASDEAWQMVGQGRRVPETVLMRMDGKGRVELQDYLRRKAEVGTKAPKTDPVFLAKIYDMARDDPEGFKALRMEPLALRIAGSDMEQVAALQRKMSQPDKEKDVATTTQLLSTYTGTLHRPEQKAAFNSAAFDELDKFEKEKGRPATFQEKRKLFDSMMVEGEVLSGSWFKNDPNKRLFETTPEERKRFAPTVSSDDRKLIVEALKAEGKANPTDAEIVARFKLAKGIR